LDKRKKWGLFFMGKQWKDSVIDRKLRFIKLLKDGAPVRKICTELGIDNRKVRDWRDTIKVFGEPRFLMTHTTKTKYAYELKLAAAKARVEDGMPIAEVMAKYGVKSPNLLGTWCRIYRDQGEAGLLPKKKGPPLLPKNKPQQAISYVEELELRVKRLEAENAILKKVKALKDLKN
jgi:transposase-like protein